MGTNLLGRIGVRVVGLSRSPPLTSASTLPCGVPSRFARRRAFARRATTPALASRAETLRVHAARFRLTAHLRRRPCSPACGGAQRFLSRASLLGLSKVSPPSTWLLRVHSRTDRNLFFGSGLPRPELVPSLPFLWASTVCSAHQLAGLLRPAADHGVRHVSGWMTVSAPCTCCARRGCPLDFAARPVWVPRPVMARQPDSARTVGSVPRSRLPPSRPVPFDPITPVIGVTAAPVGRRVAARPVEPSSAAARRRCRRSALLPCTRPGAVDGAGQRVQLLPFPMALHPSKVSPRLQPRRVTTALAISHLHRPICSRCRASNDRWGASWLCSTVELVAVRRVAASYRPILPWVCVQTGTVQRRHRRRWGGCLCSRTSAPTSAPQKWKRATSMSARRVADESASCRMR